MRLFFYYASHSFINTMKKLFKTWLAIMLVCMVFGAVVGLAITTLIPKDKKATEPSTTSASQTVDEDEVDEIKELASGEKAKKGVNKKVSDFMTSHNLEKADVVDLAVSLLFFLFLVTNIIGSKNSGRIFQPADVPMLFASPLKPQSVMMFRLIGQLGTTLLLSVFMVFQLPNLIYNAKLTVWGSVSLIIAYALICMFGTLLQVSFYTITSNMKVGSKSITSWLMVFGSVLAGAFLIFKAVTKQDTLTCAFKFFANKHTFWVPFWGWMRGFCYYANTGDLFLSMLFLVLFILGCTLMILFIWKMKADFYEDAISAAEQKAEIMEKAKSEKGTFAVIRQKDRSDKLDRDGFRHGSGASVFLHKAVYNRFRFGILKIFSKTSIVFTLVAAAVAWLSHSQNPETRFLLPIMALVVITFYRTLGNPLQEDTSREFFVLIPQSPFLKMWYSLLGSIAVNAIDLFIPMVVITIMHQVNPLVILGWYIFILSVNLFGTVVGTFINVSVPGEHSQTVKMVAQMVFLYFGMIPSLAFVIAGLFLHMVVPMLLIGTVANIGLSTLFCLFTPHFLENR